MPMFVPRSTKDTRWKPIFITSNCTNARILFVCLIYADQYMIWCAARIVWWFMIAYDCCLMKLSKVQHVYCSTINQSSFLTSNRVRRVMQHFHRNKENYKISSSCAFIFGSNDSSFSYTSKLHRKSIKIGNRMTSIKNSSIKFNNSISLGWVLIVKF
jgi:hypothetical protein